MLGWSDTDANRYRQYPAPFISIHDIGELLRLSCGQGPQLVGSIPQLLHRRFKKGGAVYRQGQLFDSLYIVRFGFLKTVVRDIEGVERVLSFPMKSNLLGFDGIWEDRYSSEATALTDCQLIAIPFKQLLSAKHSCRELEALVYRAISREFSEGHAGVSMSSPLKAEARVARFLEELANRYAALGYSSKEIVLPMTRRDIGSYLGLSLETVSRSFSILASMGVIEVHRKMVTILETEMLHRFHTCPIRLAQKDRLHPLNMLQRTSGANA